jgi:hypothetical protein
MWRARNTVVCMAQRGLASDYSAALISAAQQCGLRRIAGLLGRFLPKLGGVRPAGVAFLLPLGKAATGYVASPDSASLILRSREPFLAQNVI